MTEMGKRKNYTVVQRKYNTVTAKRDDGKTVKRNVSFFQESIPGQKRRRMKTSKDQKWSNYRSKNQV